MSLKHLFKNFDVEEERRFYRQSVLQARERFLEINPVEKYRTDPVYSVKVDRFRRGIQGRSGTLPKGWILDIGAATAGEATVVCQEGARIIVGDINEAALQVSRERARKFGLIEPACVAMDVHRIPFADASFDCVTVLEALHHFPDQRTAMAEIHRVLKPGGSFYAQEPNAMDPLRRLSEVRDRLRGTIETSFYRSQLERLCRNAGFEDIVVQPGVLGRSSVKLGEIPGYRRWLTRFHSVLQTRFPRAFGSHEIHARKAGVLTGDAPDHWHRLLREPGGAAAVRHDPTTGRWQVDGRDGAFPDLDGIPVLIPSESIQ